MKYVLSDFDGTLTNENMIGPEFLQVLSFLKEKKIELVIVTGRSVSWAHFLLTHFPVHTVIAEGGGVAVSKDLTLKTYSSSEELSRLDKLSKSLIEEFKEISLSADSFGRLCDRAIELSLLKELNLLDKVQSFLQGKCHFSCSNVHLNFWLGDISKEKASLDFCQLNDISSKDIIYFGDAPNDQGMFRTFTESVGVSNISSYLDQMESRPKYILEGKDKEGAKGVLYFLRNSSKI